MDNILSTLKNKIDNIKNQLDTNPEYNRTRESRSEVERRILKWENMLSTANENNISSIESAINIDISQLDKDIFSINTRHSQSSLNNDTINSAMKEANMLSSGSSNSNQNVDNNISKLNKTRELMRRAGLL